MNCAWWVKRRVCTLPSVNLKTKHIFAQSFVSTTAFDHGPTCNMVTERIDSARKNSEAERRSRPPVVACSGDANGCPTSCRPQRSGRLSGACCCCGAVSVTNMTPGQPCFLELEQGPVGANSLARLRGGAAGPHLECERSHAHRDVTVVKDGCSCFLCELRCRGRTSRCAARTRGASSLGAARPKHWVSV